MNFNSRQEKIYNKYKKYEVIKDNKDYCNSKSFILSNQQTFLSEYMKTNNKLLLFHLPGSGKTCTSIRICEVLKNEYNILVLVPASLIGNYYNELFFNRNGSCAKYKSYEQINKYYEIISYNKFFEDMNFYKKKYYNKNVLLVIDEIHNLISLNGVYYNLLFDFIYKTKFKKFKILLMTATPINNRPHELSLLFKLFDQSFPSFKEFDKLLKDNETKSLNAVEKFSSLYISYFRGPSNKFYPSHTINIIKCKLKEKQLKEYLLKSVNFEELNQRGNDLSEVNFYIESRSISNISSNPDFKNIINHSCKFFEINKKITSSEGKIFMYSNFRNEYGIESFIKYIEYLGWKNYNECSNEEIIDKKIKKFGVWSGQENSTKKENIKKIFNSKQNINGDIIKMILGSSAIKEGISLKSVRQVHILEPYWNFSRIYQIMSRAIRLCSHHDLEKEKRNVDVFIYLSVLPGRNSISIDEYIWNMLKEKQILIDKFLKSIKLSSFDYLLFKNINF